MTSRYCGGVFSFLNSATSQERESLSMPFLTVYHFQRVLVVRRKFEEKSVFVFPCLKKVPSSLCRSLSFPGLI